MSSYHIAETGKNANKFVPCKARIACRLTTEHMDSSYLEAAQDFLFTVLNKKYSINELTAEQVKAFQLHSLKEEIAVEKNRSSISGKQRFSKINEFFTIETIKEESDLQEKIFELTDEKSLTLSYQTSEERKVNIQKIIPMQNNFSPLALEHYLKQKNVIAGTSHFELTDNKTPLAIETEGKIVLVNGTHRFLAAHLAGDKTFTLNILKAN